MVRKGLNMFRVVISSLMFLIVDASNRRLITQMNNIKEEIGFINNDITSLFQNMDKINKTVISNSQENPIVKTKGDRRDQQTKMVSGQSNGIDSREIMALLEGFKSEKRLNRQLLVRLEALETKVSDSDILLEAERKVTQQLQNSLQALRTQVDDMNIAHVAEKRKVRRLEHLIRSLGTKQTLIDKNNDAITKALESSNEKQSEMFEQLQMLKESDTGMRKELESQTQLNGQLQIQAMERECITACNKDVGLPENIPPIINPKIVEIVVPTPAHVCTNATRSGVYNYDIYIDSHLSTKSFYCDAETDGGDWVVIMRRQDGSVNFNRSWIEYKNWFGDVAGEFWIGNDFLYQLTKSKPMELRVDMEDRNGNKVFAKYAVFKVGSEAAKYVLTVSGYSGTAGDGLAREWVYRDKRLNGMKFSTFDQDNDRGERWNCATNNGGGWWYNYCSNVLLTGTHSTGKMIMEWYNGSTWRYLKFAEMKIR